ncbi:hypothetical protein NDU88_003731 [Pleurodeles waltl]|uniref:Uncharacterized protein n=1 Tax=Pleurodeles waltl TaxID=8319 RepID=A0AAV7WQ96_PLEWA|nr:hypothetical protein NDU88_003731 [Pleurodeles waltl]
MSAPSLLTASFDPLLHAMRGCCPLSSGFSGPRSHFAGSGAVQSPGQGPDRQDNLEAGPKLLRYAAAIFGG